jgi:hypothetical protein
MNMRAAESAAMGSAVAGAVLLAGGLRLDPQRAWFAYLTAWTFSITLVVGALLLLMIGHAAKASWMVVTCRPTEAVVSLLPFCALSFVPVAFGLASLYPWAAPVAQLDPELRDVVAHRHGYMNPPFFVARTAVYLAIFGVVGGLLRYWSKQNDDRPRMALVARMRRLSAGGLPVVGLALTWASFDWTMSLDAATASTIFGLYFFAGAFVGAIALVTILVCASRRTARLRALVTVEHAHALGRVLFAMVAFWAYIAFSQLLIVWIGGIPREVAYYARRTAGTWGWVTGVLACGMFVIPFLALIARAPKRRTGFLTAVASGVLFMHYVDVYWMIIPVHDVAGLRLQWVDLGAILLFGGLSCLWVGRAYGRRSPLPAHLPEMVEGLAYEAAR